MTGRIRESTVERYLVVEVERCGGMALKWNGRVGVPDRVCLLPGGQVIFVEVKRPSGRLSKMQIHIHGKMRKLDMDVRVVWSKEDVDALIREIRVHP